MTDGEKVAEVGRILDNAMSPEQKLDAIRHVLGMATSTRHRSTLQSTWNPDDDPDARSRIQHPRPQL
ncbi:hypothetical protein AB0H36_27680 [Kribbella sp. NPDC050820]|uniref:hypothetical protein n=1 Tax=Kribbella sp. NPDC050820 TaxID=3155408 RepID=UPI0033F43A57